MKLTDQYADEDPGLNLTPMIDVVFLLLIFFMLATKPYSQFDRYSSIAVVLAGWSDTDFFKYAVQDKVSTLRVTDTALTTFFPPLRFVKFSVENTMKKAIAGM